MGLDMRPMGKPKPGYEQRYTELFHAIQNHDMKEPGFFGKLFGKKQPTFDQLREEWFSIQIPLYETIRAPRGGRDPEAAEWIKEQYALSDKSVSLEDFAKDFDGYYVISLAKELDGLPVYISLQQDENVFRGQFMKDCVDVIGEDLVSEAWETKLAPQALDYGNRLMAAADKIAHQKNLHHLKEQRMPPDDIDTLEAKVHIVYSLAKWLIFYGKNGHGYEADY